MLLLLLLQASAVGKWRLGVSNLISAALGVCVQRKLEFAAGTFQSGQAYSIVAYARSAGLESVASAARNFVTPK
jgi:hypothetical protein